jgi:hypothetical protein
MGVQPYHFSKKNIEKISCYIAFMDDAKSNV